MGSRIVLIGMGNAAFGYASLLDAVNLPGLKGSNIVLHDTDERNLRSMTMLARLMNDESGAGLDLEETMNREEALEGADFVVLNIAVDRIRRWRLDWEIPFKHGIKQVIGENGGPGGVFHTLRMVPPVLDVCREMELLCPDALLLNYVEPVSRICLAINRYTRVNAAGLSSDAEREMKLLAPFIGVPTQLLDATSAGVNRFSWFKELKLMDGEDAYPLLERGLRDAKGFQPLCRALYKRFGLYPSTSDNHVGEYFAYAWKACSPSARGSRWIDGVEAEERAGRGRIDRLLNGKEKLTIGEPSGEAAMRIIEGVVTNSGHKEPQLNLSNQGQIPNLLKETIVETPANIDHDGIHPINVGGLPDGIAAICNVQLLLQKIVVDAAVSGDKNKALRAVLADPVVEDNVAAERAFNELFETHRDLLPQFK